MSKYPRIGRTEKRLTNTAAKCPCGEIGKFRLHIEWTYMRGEDDVVWRCPQHVEYLAMPMDKEISA